MRLAGWSCGHGLRLPEGLQQPGGANRSLLTGLAMLTALQPCLGAERQWTRGGKRDGGRGETGELMGGGGERQAGIVPKALGGGGGMRM